MKKRHALIAGGTRGIGLVLGRILAEEGHVVSAIGRGGQGTHEGIQAIQAMPDVHFWSVDLTDRDASAEKLSEIVSRHGKLSSLVFVQRCRGVESEWQGEIETSLTATKNTVEHLADQFDDGEEKSIVLTASVAGQVVVGEQPLGYHVAKAGLIQMARYYAVSLAPRGIRVNCVSPSVILKQESEDYYSRNPEVMKAYQEVIPLGRMGRAVDVANAIAFLCSEKASFITGQNIVVDGGASLQGQESLARRALEHMRRPA